MRLFVRYQQQQRALQHQHRSISSFLFLTFTSCLLQFNQYQSPIYCCGWIFGVPQLYRYYNSNKNNKHPLHSTSKTYRLYFTAGATTATTAATKKTTLTTTTTLRHTTTSSSVESTMDGTTSTEPPQCPSTEEWDPNNLRHVEKAKRELNIWPLDEYNTKLLNEVHPIQYTTVMRNNNNKNTTPNNYTPEIYDLIAIGSGAGGLVSSKQSARRNAKSALISAHLAGGDCLNVGVRTDCILVFFCHFNNNPRLIIFIH